MSVYRAWAITIRPRNGICDERVSDYINWIEKSPKIVGAYGVCEKLAEERHLHLAVFLSEGRRKGDVNKQIERIFQKRSVEDGELKVLRSGTRIMYNDDFVKKYLDKNDATQVVINDVPADTIEYYPTAEEQEGVKAQKNATDQYFHSLLTKFDAWLNGRMNDPQMVRWWFGFAMYEEKSIRVITDTRKLNQIIDALYKYSNSNGMCLVDETSMMGKRILDENV
ncbi:MAG: hypothetical protein [Circular genetic element sp.]|nr:MAG: hypothetical protein [Circular genetic element sp.]